MDIIKGVGAQLSPAALEGLRADNRITRITSDAVAKSSEDKKEDKKTSKVIPETDYPDITGADQAFDLLLRALSPIHQVIVEASGSEPVNRLLQLVKIQSVPVAVDRKGLCVEKSNAVILEDDYDSEFRFDRQPPIALAALDSLQRAAYVGTFSKTMFSGLRLGYCILPEHLIPGVLDLKWFSDRCVPVVEQLALADWLESGMLERHIRKMRTIYAKRRGVLTAKLYEHFGHLVQVLGVSAGMHVLVSVL